MAATADSPNMAFPVLRLLLLLLCLFPSVCRGVDDGSLVSRIAFGSCSNLSAPQPIWNAIVDFDPQLFIWLGDNIYADIRRPFKIFGKERTIGSWKNVLRFVPSGEQEMVSRYNKAKENPGYTRLRSLAQVIATWDDHDYGLNDAGKEFSEKDVSQKLMLDFLDEPLDSPRQPRWHAVLSPPNRKAFALQPSSPYDLQKFTIKLGSSVGFQSSNIGNVSMVETTHE